MGTGRSKGLSYKSVMVFFTFTKKMGDCIEKGLLPNCQKKHGKGDTEKESKGDIGNRKVEFMKGVVTCILT